MVPRLILASNSCTYLYFISYYLFEISIITIYVFQFPFQSICVILCRMSFWNPNVPAIYPSLFSVSQQSVVKTVIVLPQSKLLLCFNIFLLKNFIVFFIKKKKNLEDWILQWLVILAYNITYRIYSNVIFVILYVLFSFPFSQRLLDYQQ